MKVFQSKKPKQQTPFQNLDYSKSVNLRTSPKRGGSRDVEPIPTAQYLLNNPVKRMP